MTDTNGSIDTGTALSPAREAAHIERQRAIAETTFGGGVNPFSNGDAFKLACAIAERIAGSTFIPEAYQGKPENVLVAMDYSARLNISVLMLMQNMDVVKGRPGLRGAFLAALVNKSPLFSRLKYEWRGQDAPGKEPSLDFGCRAYATEIATGETVYGAWIDWRMVKSEGWDKNAKWTGIREQMFMYRAASFFSRVHASDVTLGMYEVEELRDAIEGEFSVVRETNASRLRDRLDAAGDGQDAPPADEKPKRRGSRKAVQTEPSAGAPADPAPIGEDEQQQEPETTASEGDTQPAQTGMGFGDVE